MTRLERHSVKKPVFWKVYFIYLIIIALAFAALFFYVRSTMLEYERNNPENYVVWLAQDASDNSELGKYLEEHNFSDTRYGDAKSRKSTFYDTIKTAVSVPNLSEMMAYIRLLLSGSPVFMHSRRL